MKYEAERRNSLLFAPTQPLAEQERPICRRSEWCKDCPYPGHGFICWQNDGTCLRTRMKEINEKENIDHDDQRSSK